MRRRLIIAITLLALGVTAAVQAADPPGGASGAAAGPPARADADPRLAVAHPVPPRKVGRAPQATLILRARDPEGGTPYAVTIKPVVRDRGPAAWRRVVCLDVARIDQVERRRFSAGGCAPSRPEPGRPAPMVHGSTAMLDEATLLRGFAPAGTRRLTVAGIGPTVPSPPVPVAPSCSPSATTRARS